MVCSDKFYLSMSLTKKYCALNIHNLKYMVGFELKWFICLFKNLICANWQSKL